MQTSPISTLPLSLLALSKTANQLQPSTANFLRQAPQNTTFLEFVGHIGKSTRDSLQRSEAISKAAALGDADPQQVTIEVLRAKTALHQLTVLVNTSLQACQELLKMGV